jgi:hypothetical protein
MLRELLLADDMYFWEKLSKAFLLTIVSYVVKGGLPSVISSSRTMATLAHLHHTFIVTCCSVD